MLTLCILVSVYGPQRVERLGHIITVVEPFEVGMPLALQPARPLRFEAGPLLLAVLPYLAE